MAINTRYLQEAFSQFELLEEEAFDLGANGSEEAKDFIDNDEYIDFTDVIDDEAETEDELESSYDGKVVLDCSVCHSKIFKAPEDVKYDEEEAELVNVGEECPFCYSVDGFKVLGQITPFVQDADFSEEEPAEEVEEEPAEDIEDEEVEDDVEVEESLTEGKEGMVGTILGDHMEEINKCTTPQEVFSTVNGLIPDAKKGEPKVKKFLANLQRARNLEKAFETTTNFILKGEGLGSIEKEIAGKKVEENLEECDEADKAEEIEESYNGSVKDWLADHEQAVEDIENHFEKALEDISEEDVINWIGEHDTLYDDYVRAFGLEESLYDKLKALKLEGVDEAYEPGVGEIIEDVEEEEEEGEEEADSDVANALHDLLNDESEAIQGYNDAAEKMEGHPELQDLAKDIAGEEYAHIGEIQQALKSTVAPEAEEIEAGEDEAKEMIAPLEPETVDEIEVANEDEVEAPEEEIAVEDEIEEPIDEEPVEEVEGEEMPEDEYADEDMDEFDEEEFDDLGESYLKKVYENVQSFKTTEVEMIDESLMVEGTITFDSGATKNTSFKFTPKDACNGKLRFIGENLQITKGQNAFALIGSINEGKFISESLDYSYNVGEQNIRGTISK